MNDRMNEFVCVCAIFYYIYFLCVFVIRLIAVRVSRWDNDCIMNV